MTRVDRRKMWGLGDKIGTKKHTRMKEEGKRLRQAGHLHRMSEEILTNKARKTEEGSRMRRSSIKMEG